MSVFASRCVVCLSLTLAHSALARRVFGGGGVALRDVEMLAMPNCAPRVELHCHVAGVGTALKFTDVRVSISHSGDNAIAHCVAR